MEGDEKLEGYRSSFRGSQQSSRDSSADGGKFRRSRKDFRRGNSGCYDKRSQSRDSKSPARGGGIQDEVECLCCGSNNRTMGQDLVLDTENNARVAVMTVHSSTLLTSVIREERITKALL